MAKTLRGVLLSVGVLWLGAPSIDVAWADKKAAEAKPPKGFNRKSFEAHLASHQHFPATKAELLAECDNLSDISPADRKWIAATLPDKSYRYPETVMEALGLETAGKK